MIEINQRSIAKLHKSTLNNLLSEYGKCKLSFNTQSIIDDIKKMDDWEKETSSELKIKNYQKIKKYLESMLKKVKKEEHFEIEWRLKGNKLVSLPIEMRKIQSYGINSIDYINLENKRVFEIDYSKIIDYIVFELVHRDFDFTHKDIEAVLQDLGMIAIYHEDYLSFVEEGIYEKALVMRVGESPAISSDRNSIYTYFGTKCSDTKSYEEVVTKTSEEAMLIIVNSILSKISVDQLQAHVCGVFEKSLYIITEKVGEAQQLEKFLSSEVSVRVFGRRFECKPKIQIY